MADEQNSPQKKHGFGYTVDPSVGKATQIQPGEVRNPGGRPKKTPITEIYERIFADSGNLELIEAAILKTILSGRMGSVLTLKEAAERIEGKVVQAMEHSGEITLTLAERMKKAAERTEVSE